MKAKSISFIIITASILLTACGTAAGANATPTVIPTVKADQTIIAEARLEPVHYADIGFDVGGLVGEVPVSEGDQVAANDLIARLENTNAQTLAGAQAKALKDLTDANEAVRLAQIKLDNFEVPSDLKQLTPAQAVEQTLAKVEDARKAYEPYKYLKPANDKELAAAQKRNDNNIAFYSTAEKLYKKQLDDAWGKYHTAINWMQMESNLETAQANLDTARKNYESLQAGSNTANIAGVRASLANAEIRAPFAGTIAKLDVKSNEFATAGQSVVTIADFSTWVAKTTDLTELDVVNIVVGDPVTLTLDAIPGLTLNGKVKSISQTFTEKQGDVTYIVTVELTNTDPRMRWGMTARIKFQK